jgi:hypothetical protein
MRQLLQRLLSCTASGVHRHDLYDATHLLSPSSKHLAQDTVNAAAT